MARIYLWDWKTWESIPQDLKDHTVSLVEDLPNGMTRLKCGHCHNEFDQASGPSQFESCPVCGGDIIFPRADW